MARLYMLTVPDLEVKWDWATAHDRLLNDFSQITDVLATTMAGTLLIVYEGDPDVDAWLDRIGQAILSRRLRAARALRADVRAASPTCRRRSLGRADPASDSAIPQ